MYTVSAELNQWINESYQRCRQAGLNPALEPEPKHCTKKRLDESLKHSEDLLLAVEEILPTLSPILINSKYVLFLFNTEGIMLYQTGDAALLSVMKLHNVVPGNIITEELIGTNAISLALTHDIPVLFKGPEHYLDSFKSNVISATPIHNENKQIVAIASLVTDKKKISENEFDLLFMKTQIVKNSIENVLVQKKLSDAQQFAYNIMNTITYGMLTVNLKEQIQWINNQACRMLEVERAQVINQYIGTFYEDWTQAKLAVHKKQPFNDEEGTFVINGKREVYLITVSPMRNREFKTIGYLLSFREFKLMMNLVSKFAGLRARYTFDDIIGKHPSIRTAISLAKSAATSPSTVLITGESGVGKEVFAQSIHNASERRDAGFVAVNCGAIPDNLIESELFGYADGAFTGAKKGGNPGKFELADNGTLFLDEIGEMPVDMQVKLLRALQEGVITRVGGDKQIPVNVRIIAATNKHLEEMVRTGRFRLDLFYRLNVFPIEIPSLKERKSDIIEYANLFFRQKSAKLNKPIPSLSQIVWQEMQEYSWPGNIRELENFIEKSIILDGNIRLNMQESGLDKSEQAKATRVAREELLITEVESLETLERRAILHAISQFDGNISQVAKQLGIGRNTLYSKMKRYHIEA